MLSNSHSLPPVVLPEALPDTLPQPKFRLGEPVSWAGMTNPDFGRIVGVIYSDETVHQVTGLHYLILLDERSTSRSICTHDFAFEDDLERMEQNRSSVGEAAT